MHGAILRLIGRVIHWLGTLKTKLIIALCFGWLEALNHDFRAEFLFNSAYFATMDRQSFAVVSHTVDIRRCAGTESGTTDYTYAIGTRLPRDQVR